MTVWINGGGPNCNILVDANAKGEVRGYVTNPQTHFGLNRIGIFDVTSAVGIDGKLIVSKDIGLKQPYVGHVPLISGELELKETTDDLELLVEKNILEHEQYKEIILKEHGHVIEPGIGRLNVGDLLSIYNKV